MITSGLQGRDTQLDVTTCDGGERVATINYTDLDTTIFSSRRGNYTCFDCPPMEVRIETELCAYNFDVILQPVHH